MYKNKKMFILTQELFKLLLNREEGGERERDGENH